MYTCEYVHTYTCVSKCSHVYNYICRYINVRICFALPHVVAQMTTLPKLSFFVYFIGNISPKLWCSTAEETAGFFTQKKKGHLSNL